MPVAFDQGELPMNRTRPLSIAFVILTTAAAFNAQKMLLNAAYLNEFPTIQRVRAETKGSDDVDSYAKYMAALTVINNFLIRDLLTAQNGGVYDMPPAAERVQSRYSNELTRLEIDAPEPPSRDPRYPALRDKYEKDPAFRDMLLLKMFSTQFRAEYYAWTRKPIPANTTAVKTAGGPSAGSGGGDGRKGSGPAANGGGDSMAKAKAANVDISLFAGAIRMGGPLNLAACPYRNNFLGVPMRDENAPDCLDTQPVAGEVAALTELIGAITNTKMTAPDPDVHMIYLTEEHRPSWMSGAAVYLRTQQGSVVRVVITTQSKDVSKRVEAELAAKYGKIYIVHPSEVTPDNGNKFTIRNLEWSLPGLHVEYSVLDPDENGRVKINGTGFVRIETEAAYQSRKAAENKPAKRVL
jgi:hypothetical protein